LFHPGLLVFDAVPERFREDAVGAVAIDARTGTVTSALTGSQLLDVIESLAVGWTATARGVLATPRQLKAERAARRKAIAEAVRRIVEPD